ncbi:CD151 antigen isoform X1 [Nomascus leucogenys]|uniref:CD151 antigen isoform X1 n=2 Tax=Nomascus leucogenys TaxID=61853 RepID=UPI00122DA398|nr:CD151 antigen isoform X1 [Nomascus leucogenys]
MGVGHGGGPGRHSPGPLAGLVAVLPPGPPPAQLFCPWTGWALAGLLAPPRAAAPRPPQCRVDPQRLRPPAPARHAGSDLPSASRRGRGLRPGRGLGGEGRLPRRPRAAHSQRWEPPPPQPPPPPPPGPGLRRVPRVLGSFYPPVLQRSRFQPGCPRMGEFNEKKTTCGTVCLKYLLFTYNCCFWLAGLAVMAVGIWTLALKSDYISLLASGTYLATAYILVVAGAVVMVTGVLGCCATFKERRNLLRLYFILLLIIFLLEIIAGILAYAYYQQLNTELKENLKDTMTKRYHQPGHEAVTSAVDQLQQEFHCCGSNNSQDWRDSEWIHSGEAGGRVVPDSCCKTVVAGCGQRDHASNIYKVEGGCITKLETFIQEHLRVIGAVGIGIACVQVFGMVFTCCLYRSLKLEHY